MTLFLTWFVPAFLAGIWLTAGLGHVVAWSRFRRTIVTHRLMAPIWAPLVATAIPAMELALGGLAARTVLRGEVVPTSVSLGSAMLALLFGLYLNGLLRRGPTPGVSCGCSPLAGPVTPWSLLPAWTVLFAALLVAVLGDVAPADLSSSPAGGRTLAVLWGLTLAGLVLLLPAVATDPSPPRHLSEARS